VKADSDRKVLRRRRVLSPSIQGMLEKLGKFLQMLMIDPRKSVTCVPCNWRSPLT
jgi:hypothetical protein